MFNIVVLLVVVFLVSWANGYFSRRPNSLRDAAKFTGIVAIALGVLGLLVYGNIALMRN